MCTFRLTWVAQKSLCLSSLLALYNNGSYLLVPRVLEALEDPLFRLYRPFLEEKKTLEGLFSIEISMIIS